MKYLKTYEKHIDDIEINDYVIVDSNDKYESQIGLFLKNTIGKVKSSIDNKVFIGYGYSVPKDLEPYFNMTGWGEYMKIVVNKDIIFSSPDKKEAEAYLATKNYNL